MNKTRRLFKQAIREMFFILKLAHLVFRMSHLRMISSLNDVKETRKMAFWRSLRKKTRHSGALCKDLTHYDQSGIGQVCKFRRFLCSPRSCMPGLLIISALFARNSNETCACLQSKVF